MFLVMIVAASIHVKNGFFAINDGIELPMLYAMGALVLTFTGPGGYSLDRVLGLLGLSNEQFASRAIWIAVAVGVVMISARRGLAQRTAHAT
jgi:hypothetical protein